MEKEIINTENNIYDEYDEIENAMQERAEMAKTTIHFILKKHSYIQAKKILETAMAIVG